MHGIEIREVDPAEARKFPVFGGYFNYDLRWYYVFDCDACPYRMRIASVPMLVVRTLLVSAVATALLFTGSPWIGLGMLMVLFAALGHSIYKRWRAPVVTEAPPPRIRIAQPEQEDEAAPIDQQAELESPEARARRS